MGTNEFYYNGEKLITCEEAHALKDKSNIVVADIEQTKVMLNKIKDAKILQSTKSE